MKKRTSGGDYHLEVRVEGWTLRLTGLLRTFIIVTNGNKEEEDVNATNSNNSVIDYYF